MRLSLVLTHQCDLACDYCYTGRKFERTMPLEVGRRALERGLRSVPRDGTLEVSLFGGEPLLAWDLGRELLRHAHTRAARAGVRLLPQLTTNGTRLDARTIDEATALGVNLAVSMDGLPEVHDAARPRRGGQPSSDAALRAIDLLVAARLPFKVVSVVRPASVDHLAAGARFLADRGVAHVVPNLDVTAPWTLADAPRLRAAVRGLRELKAARPRLRLDWLDAKTWSLENGGRAGGCGVGEGEVAVAPSGRLYPCERLVVDDPDPAGGPLAAGHVDDGDGPFAAFGLSARPDDASECGPCATRPHCSNACACANLGRTGALDGPDGLICVVEQACLDEAALALGVNPPPRGRMLPLSLGGVHDRA